MWKKAEPDPSERRGPAPTDRPVVPPVWTGTAASLPTSGGEVMTAERPSDRAIIGPSITIKGDVTGEEDLLIQGRIEGKVDLAQHHVTVGANGRIKANVFGHSVTVEGSVEGDLHAEEQIVIRKSGNVRGNVAAPRVTIEDGATFQGSIDMERKAPPRPAVAPSSPAIASPAARTSLDQALTGGTPRRPNEAKRPEGSS
ncbi:MAG: polymer-forming cytoskeletal protein [Thermoanaerobaculales bacterium]